MTKVLKKIKKRSLFLQKTTLLTFLLISSLLVNAQQQKIVLKGKVFDEKTDEVDLTLLLMVYQYVLLAYSSPPLLHYIHRFRKFNFFFSLNFNSSISDYY